MIDNNNKETEMGDGIGAIFKNKGQKKARSPHLTGTLELSPELVAALVKEIKEGRPAKLNMAGWKNIAARSGERYITVKVQTPYKHEEQSTLPIEEDDPFDL